MTRRISSYFACLLLATAGLLDADPIAPPAATLPATRPNFIETLVALDARAAQIRDLVADFEQRKYSTLLREPLVTRGEVRAKDAVMFWRADEPEATRTRVTFERMQIYYIKQKLVEDYPIAGKLGSLAASPQPRLTALREQFQIDADTGEGLAMPEGVSEPLTLRLVPTRDEVKQYVSQIRVVIDPTRGVLTTFEMVDPDGEKTVMRFSNIRLNTGIEASSLDLGATRDAKITRPLEPGK